MGTANPVELRIEPHPELDAIAFETVFDRPLGEIGAVAGILAKLAAPGSAGAEAPVASSDEVRAAVRDLLRHGGYKPTGRGKPASEYLLRAVPEGALGTINAAVDACNAASFHSGLPISVVDLDKARAPFSIGVAPAGSSYVFNACGQVIDIGGLLVLSDAEGPCANAVKDAQRTKTSAATTRTLSIVWGTKRLVDHSEKTFAFYKDLLALAGGVTRTVVATP